MRQCVTARAWRAEGPINSRSRQALMTEVPLHRCCQWGSGSHSRWTQIWSGLLRWPVGHCGSPRGITTHFSQTPELREGTGMLRRFCSLLLNNHSLLPEENAMRMKQQRQKRGLKCVGSWLWHLLVQRGESALSLLEVTAVRSRTYLLRRGASAFQKLLIQKHRILYLLMNFHYALPHTI